MAAAAVETEKDEHGRTLWQTFCFYLVVVNGFEVLMALPVLGSAPGAHIRPGFGNPLILLGAASGLVLLALYVLMLLLLQVPWRWGRGLSIVALALAPIHSWGVATVLLMMCRDQHWAL